MTRQAIADKASEFYANAKRITDKAEAEKRDVTDAELLAVKSACDEGDRVNAELDAFDAREAVKARIATATKGTGRKSQPDNPDTAITNGVKARVEADPKKGFKNGREFLVSVLHRETSRAHKNTAAQNEALEILATAGSDEQGRYADPFGGYLVPEGFSPDLKQVATEADPTIGRTMSIPMTSPIINIPARVDKNHSNSVSGGLRVYRRSETDTSSSSRQEYENIKLEATSLFGITYATEEILRDSPISLAALLEAGYRDEFAAKLLNEKLFGTGVGEYLGVDTSAAKVSVAKETGQNAATIVYDNILKMRARCWGYGSAIWLANHDTIPQLAKLNQGVGTGGVVVWAPSAREDVPDLLMGRPIFFSEFPKTIGTVGDIILGNWSQYLEGQRVGGPQMAESIHVRFVNHERTFKFWMENDGRPWWRSALTPKRGSTLSPFVTLDTRA